MVGAPGAYIAVGVFDGVHLGHQSLLRKMVADAGGKGLRAVCLTLDPDPEAVLHPDHAPPSLSSVDERVNWLESLGLQVETLPFDDAVAQQSAEAFLQGLAEKYEVRGLWGGADFALGRDRSGTISSLQGLGERLGFEVVGIDLLQEMGRPISSTWIRELLREGNVRHAAELLGRPYALRGPVAHGAERGRQIGFPTANVVPPPGRALPADGVYFVKANVDGAVYFGAANLGGRPTFAEDERLLETHLFDFVGDLYGAVIEVSFLEQLRPTRRFESINELRTQIRQDIARGRELVEKEKQAG